MRFFFVLIAFLMMPLTAWAGQACYQPDEFQAEQVVRFQTQLMVIAMVCDPHTDQELYGDYQKFSTLNQDIIKNNEQTLVQFFKNNNDPDSLKKLHTLRTEIANEMAGYASTQVPSKFCRKFKTRIDEAIGMTPTDLTVLVSGMSTDLPSSHPLCAVN